MKNRKLLSLACAALLSFSVVGAAAAATVPSAVYGGTGEHTAAAQVSAGLSSYGVSDVSATDWYAGSTVVLLQSGLIQPSATGQLNANAPISANTAVAIIAKVLGIASKTDNDATAAAKSASAGLSANANADGTLPRIELAKLLAKALGVEPSTKSTLAYPDAVGLSTADNAILLALKERGFLIGFEDGTFRADAPLTLAQVAVIVDRLLSAK